MPTLAAPLDCAKLETRNERIHQLSTAPSSPVTGQCYYNTTDNTFYWWNGTAWRSADASSGVGGPPTGPAGGDLSGSYPNPQILANTIVAGDIANATITDVQVATANKDGANGTACMRTLGRGGGQAMQGLFGLDSIAAGVGATGSITASSQKITNVADPTLAQDAATKNYVDTFAQGLDSHPSVRVMTAANIPTLAGGAPNVLDGVTLVLGDRILVKDQSSASQNGIYTVTTLGTGANGTWSRATDQDTWAEVPSAYVWVESGAAGADTGWTCTSDRTGVLGTDSINWVLFASAAGLIAGSGLTKNGNTLDVGGTANRITVAADSVDISAAYNGQTSITVVGTITNGQWNGNAVPVAYGGTGQATATLAREAGLLACGYYTMLNPAASSWTITGATHGLAQGGSGRAFSTGLIVQVQVESTGAIILPDVTVNGANGNVTVTFSVSQTASTIRTTIIG